MGSESERLWESTVWFGWFWFFSLWKKVAADCNALCGLALMVYPYFMPNALALVLIGSVLVAIPDFFRL